MEKNKKCPKCGFNHADQDAECLRCGIIFAKYQNFQKTDPLSGYSEIPIETDSSSDENSIGNEEIVEKADFWSLLKNLFFYEKPDSNPIIFGVRVLFFLILVIWGMVFIFSPIESGYAMESFWHLVNLPFHEAGHIIFRPLGRFMTSLGGSLAQVSMPFVCFLVFLIKMRDTFAASFALWWTGQNFIDLAPYINDATSLTLPLVGGNTGQTSPYGFHDWEFILKESGLIRHDHAIATFFHWFGAIVMIMAMVWGGYVLYRQFRNFHLWH